MIAIIDYGAGNLFSVQNALSYIGEKFIVTNNAEEIRKADSMILPGVGAFPFAMERLSKCSLIAVIKEEAIRKPILGICLGMQMLFEDSCEFGQTKGLSLLSGKIDHIPTSGLKVPHMGWNGLQLDDKHNPLIKGLQDGDCVYFVHSYMAVTTEENIAASVNYGVKVPALTSKNFVFGTQFHPEKSGETGLQILRNFGGLTR